MRDDTRVPPLPTSGEADREKKRTRGKEGEGEGARERERERERESDRHIWRNHRARRKQKITGLRLVLFGAAHTGGTAREEGRGRGERGRDGEAAGMRDGDALLFLE